VSDILGATIGRSQFSFNGSLFFPLRHSLLSCSERAKPTHIATPSHQRRVFTCPPSLLLSPLPFPTSPPPPLSLPLSPGLPTDHAVGARADCGHLVSSELQSKCTEVLLHGNRRVERSAAELADLAGRSESGGSGKSPEERK